MNPVLRSFKSQNNYLTRGEMDLFVKAIISIRKVSQNNYLTRGEMDISTKEHEQIMTEQESQNNYLTRGEMDVLTEYNFSGGNMVSK